MLNIPIVLPVEKWAEYPRILKKWNHAAEIKLTDADIARFWSKVEKGDGCWIWKGHKSKKGYGGFGVLRAHVLAHRFSAYLAGIYAPAPMHVCHRCDNPSCVRPDHLFPGTKSENMKDASNKGRLRMQKNPFEVNNLRVSPEKALEIKREKATVGGTAPKIAARLGVTPNQVRYILTKPLRKVDKHYAAIAQTQGKE